jgi:excisionase family DNA binding protein
MVKRNEIFEKRAFSIAEAALYACVSRGTIEGWLARGLIPFEELPGSGAYRFRRIRKVDLDVFLEGKHKPAIEPKRKQTRSSRSSSSSSKTILLPRGTC